MNSNTDSSPVAIITGASGGLGSATARALSKEGYRLVLMSRGGCKKIAAETGGIGIAETLYKVQIQLLKKTLNLMESCKCKEKCPGCVMSPKCGNNNEPLDKHGAISLIKRLINNDDTD